MSFSALLKLLPLSDGYDVMCLLQRAFEPDIPVAETATNMTSVATSVRRSSLRSITFYVNHTIVAELQLGANMSQQPLVGIHLTTLQPDDEVSIMWLDSESGRGTASVFV